MSCIRRSQSVAPPTKRGTSLTGFVRLEFGTEATPSSPSSPSRKRRSSTGSNNKAMSARWLFAVLHRNQLRCFARRADVKMQNPPVCELELDLTPSPEATKPFSFDHECLYVRCRHTPGAVTIRLHEANKINHWVTALYYQALADSSTTSASASAPAVKTITRPKTKSVSFLDAPEISILPVVQDPVDKADLYYTKQDYAEFLRRWKDDVTTAKGAGILRVGERCK